MDETDDPFAGIIRNCITTADEEEQLRNCSFTVEFDNFPESFFVSQSSPPAPLKQFGVTMLSLAVTDSVDGIPPRENEKFQSRTSISGSDDKRPNMVTSVSAGEDTAVDCGDGKEAQVRVDLGKDNDNLGFLKPREVTMNGCRGGDWLERTDKVEYSEGDFDEPLRKRIRICEKNLRMPSSITDLEVEEIVRDEVDEEDGIKRNVDIAVTKSEDGENHGKKHANGMKESCTAGYDGSMRGRRELPLWMRGGEKNGQVEGVGKEAMKKGHFKDIIEVTMEVFRKKDGENKDADFFETAEWRNMLFPRPRWWPPELFVD
ncbi:hypothetical protein P3S67_010379 [Capsicum chacoense]